MEKNSSNFDGVIRCDVTKNGLSMTWDEYRHVEEIDDKITRDPWNVIMLLLMFPLSLVRVISLMIALMTGSNNKVVNMFLDPESKFSQFTAKTAKKLLRIDKYADEEYKRIMEVPFWERHPERYTKSCKKHNR